MKRMRDNEFKNNQNILAHCFPVSNYHVYKIKEYGRIDGGINAIKAEIFNHGPISCGMAVPMQNRTFIENYTGWVAWAPDAEIDHIVSVEFFFGGFKIYVHFLACWMGR